MAGASAVYTLQERGYEVTIIEQNDRLGGRLSKAGIRNM